MWARTTFSGLEGFFHRGRNPPRRGARPQKTERYQPSDFSALGTRATVARYRANGFQNASIGWVPLSSAAEPAPPLRRCRLRARHADESASHAAGISTRKEVIRFVGIKQLFTSFEAPRSVRSEAIERD